MTLNIQGKIYSLENNKQNVEKFIEKTIWGITPKYEKWYWEFKSTEIGTYWFRKLNNIN